MGGGNQFDLISFHFNVKNFVESIVHQSVSKYVYYLRTFNFMHTFKTSGIFDEVQEFYLVQYLEKNACID